MPHGKVIPRTKGGEKKHKSPVEFSLNCYKSSLVLHCSQNGGKRGIQLQCRFWGVSCECMTTSHVTWLVPPVLILWGGHRMESLTSVGHQDTWGFHVLSLAFPKEVNFTQIKKKTKKQRNEEVCRSDWVVSVYFLILISPKDAWVSSSTYETFLTHH